jgi:hypothetical protein
MMIYQNYLQYNLGTDQNLVWCRIVIINYSRALLKCRVLNHIFLLQFFLTIIFEGGLVMITAKRKGIRVLRKFMHYIVLPKI